MSAGVLVGSAAPENAVPIVPAVVPVAPGFFSAGTYGLNSSDPFVLNLTAASTGSTGSYFFLINLINMQPESIGEVNLSIDGPARIGDAFALDWGPVYGPADASSSQNAQFVLDEPWGISMSASTLFELEVLDPVDTADIALTIQTLPVPEPGSAALVGLGLVFMGRRTTRARRRR